MFTLLFLLLSGTIFSFGSCRASFNLRNVLKGREGGFAVQDNSSNNADVVGVVYVNRSPLSKKKRCRVEENVTLSGNLKGNVIGLTDC